MKTLQLTDAEYNIVKHAVEVHNDIMADTMFENVTEVNLFPREGDEPTVLWASKAKKLREEIYMVVDEAIAIRGLMAKLGLEVRADGFSK